jgi:hypothetical protein
MPFVRGRLGALRLKRIPALEVREDDTAERGTRVLEILHELEEGQEPGLPPAAETLPTPLGLRGRPEPPRPRRKRRITPIRGSR